MQTNRITYKAEYEALIPELRKGYFSLHPNASEANCQKYVHTQILRKARKLYDYQIIADYATQEEPSLREILRCHKSSAERLECNFYTSIHPYIARAKRILDIGCGLAPLGMIPYNEQAEYYCVDKDRKILTLLKMFSERFYQKQLVCIKSDFQSPPEELVDLRFEIVVMQKLIPMLEETHQRRVLDNIMQIQADAYLITAGKYSLSQNHSIQAREVGNLKKFFERYSLCIIERFDWTNEFGYLVTRR